jgi:hypothetical protein
MVVEEQGGAVLGRWWRRGWAPRVWEREEEEREVRDGSGWERYEDLTLCDAYLEITQDPIIGTEQRGSSYWKRIYDYFLAHIGEESDRNQNSIQHRWAHINEHVSKFCGALAQIEKRNKSGTTQVDKVQILLLFWPQLLGSLCVEIIDCVNLLCR